MLVRRRGLYTFATWIAIGGLPSCIPSRNQLFEHRPISSLGPIHSIEGKSLPALVVRMRTDPRVFVGESPGLNRRAAHTIQARSQDAPINVGLPVQVVFLGAPSRIHRQRDIEFGDVNPGAKGRKTRNVCSEV